MLVYCGQGQGRCIIKDTDDNALEFFTKVDLKKALRAAPNLKILGCELKGNILDLLPMPDKAFKSPLPFMKVEDGVLKSIDLDQYDPVRDGVGLVIRLSEYGWKFNNSIWNYNNQRTNKFISEFIILQFDDNIFIDFNNIARLFDTYNPAVRLDTNELSDPQFLVKLVKSRVSGRIDTIIDSKRSPYLRYYNVVATLMNSSVNITSYKDIQSNTNYEDANCIYAEFKDLLIASMKNDMTDNHVTRDVKLSACTRRSALSIDTLDIVYWSGGFFSNYVKVYGNAIPLELKNLYVDYLISYMNELLIYPDKNVLLNGDNVQGLVGYKSSVEIGKQARFELISGLRLEIDGDILRAIVIMTNDLSECKIKLSKYCRHVASSVIKYNDDIYVNRHVRDKLETIFVLDDNLDVDRDAFYCTIPGKVGLDITAYHDDEVIKRLYSNVENICGHLIDSPERFYKEYAVKCLVAAKRTTILSNLSSTQLNLIQKYVTENESRLIKQLKKFSKLIDENKITLRGKDFEIVKKYYLKTLNDVGVSLSDDMYMRRSVEYPRGLVICMSAYYCFNCSKSFKDAYIATIRALYKKLCHINGFTYN